MRIERGFLPLKRSPHGTQESGMGLTAERRDRIDTFPHTNLQTQSLKCTHAHLNTENHVIDTHWSLELVSNSPTHARSTHTHTHIVTHFPQRLTYT